MTHEFDEHYWQEHWQERTPGEGATAIQPNPYLVGEIRGLSPGRALEAGCGEGGEAIWLAAQGWAVTAVDISADALAGASRHEAELDPPVSVDWVLGDLTVWEPGQHFDLVTTHYAHSTMPQLSLYDRISGWVAPGGTLLIVGHLHVPGHEPGEDEPPAHASVTLADITARLVPGGWVIVTAEEHVRTRTGPDGRAVSLNDVVVRATRRA